MFFNLVYRNAMRSRKENLIYFATLVTAVASFYIILSLERQDVILYLKDFESEAVDKLFSLMPILYLFALFLLFFLVLFANRYQLERRSKEFGMYLMLGMRQYRLFFLLVAEGIVTSFIALVMGITIGALLSEILSLTTSRLIGQGILGHQLSFSLQAVLYTAAGFLLIQIVALLLLAGNLFHRELLTLLKGQVAKKQKMGKIQNNWLIFITGVIALVSAYWLILKYFKVVHFLMILLALVLGLIGTILVIRGVARILNLLALKANDSKGLSTFTLRQLQENIASRSTAVAVSSILMMLALILLAEGTSTILSSTDQLKRETSVYDFTVQGEEEKIQDFLTSEAMTPYVTNLNPMEIGMLRPAESADGTYQSLLDWTNLRERIIAALPEGVEDPALANPNHSTISPEQSEAENLLGLLDGRISGYLVKESRYNSLLAAANEEPIRLGEDEVALYLNPEFGARAYPLLTELLTQAQANGEALLFVEGEPLHLRPELPLKGLVTDRSITVAVALVVPDAFFETYTEPANREIYWNFTVPQAMVAERGLMVPMKEASNLLGASGLQFESYLQNFGRQLFYIVAGSYTMVYLGFLFLVIGCTVLALQFLTQLKQTRERYRTLSFLGMTRRQMNHSIKKQIFWYFLFPIIPALISGTVGILAMNNYVVSNADFLPALGKLLPFIILMIALFILVQWLYATAVYRTAVREIEQQQYKPSEN